MRNRNPVRQRVRRVSRLLRTLLRGIGAWIDKWVYVKVGSRSSTVAPKAGLYHLEPLEPRVLLSADLGLGAAYAFQPEPVTAAVYFTLPAAVPDQAPQVRIASLKPAAAAAAPPLTDADGTQVEFVLSGPGSVAATPLGDGFDLALTGTSAASTPHGNHHRR